MTDRRPRLGPLTEVSGLRQAAEQFQRVSPDLPSAARLGNPLPRHREKAAERHRQRGARLLKARRPAPAITAFGEAIRLDPRNGDAHHALGCALLDVGRIEDAIEHLRLATVLRDDAAAFHSLAVALRRQHLNDEAAAAYRRAIELDPTLSEAHVGLADLLEAGGESEAAAQSLRTAASLMPSDGLGSVYLARALMIEGDFVTAEAKLREAAALDPTDDEVIRKLGHTLARLGRFAEAADMFERALAVNQRNCSAYFAIAEIRKHTEADRPRLARMLALLEDMGLDDDDRIPLHFAAGKVFDELGDYQAAMGHFDAAHRLGARYAQFDAAAFTADIDRLMRRFTRDFFAANTGYGLDDETPLLIVGLPRSGTTLVEQILSRHPAIGAGGEQAFWVRRGRAPSVLEASNLTIEAGREMAQQYLSLLRQLAPSAARIIDKLPFNVLCLGLIHLLLPKARIIQCWRHPVDTCLSIYFTHFHQRVAFTNDKATLAAAYRQYARLMNHWRAVLPAESLSEVEYEKLVGDRERVTRELVAFTGCGWDDACLEPERNERPVTTASLWQARQPVYSSSVARWRNYEPWLGELRSLLAPQDTEGPTS
jgi:tetratricopeptide (TPR) repeat protein